MAFGDTIGTLAGFSTSIVLNQAQLTGSVAVSSGMIGVAVFGERTTNSFGTVTDDLGNTWNAFNAGSDAGNAAGRAYWFRFTASGTLTTVTAVAVSSSDDFAGSVGIFGGPSLSSPLDANAANVTNDTTSPFTSGTTGTLAQSNELVVSWFVGTNGRDMSASSPFSLVLSTKSSTEGAANSVCAALSKNVVSAITSISADWTAAGGAIGSDVIGIASFKEDPPAAAGNPGNPFLVFKERWRKTRGLLVPERKLLVPGYSF